ncbi:hypothetical protein PDE_09410 [Penicillium oxalicum 114-2]|uniref:Uncharacterized protein n=1 Tax=Penicillium oxalicum (strain 114-2 / CGMCC 5302) TaxID=933388 RepID=S8A026_PENO1|nr:hypothetical protein PDE_09410 [Penicillium oxalicum 114-2]
MDETLPDDRAILAPVPTVDLTVEDRFRTLKTADISHVVVQLSDKRLDSIMQCHAGLTYNFDRPWPFWFLIGKALSKAFFGDEQQLRWFNFLRVWNREFVAFTNMRGESMSDLELLNRDKDKLQVIEVDFLKPVPGENLKAFWKPARGIICQRVEAWLELSRRTSESNENQAQTLPSNDEATSAL